MKNLALVAVGEYTNDFITSIETIEKFNRVFDTVYVLTDNVEKLQNYTSNTKLTYFFTFYNKDKQVDALNNYVKKFNDNGNLIFVTHYVLISEVLNYGASSGEIVISDKNFNIVGTVEIDY